MFDREGFKAYVGINSGNSYASGLENVEKVYSVDIDSEVLKDKAAQLLRRIEADKKTLTGNDRHNRQNWCSHLKKYVEFKAKPTKPVNIAPVKTENVPSRLQEKIRLVIDHYKANFATVDEQERYKWEAIGWYKKHWDIDASNFAEMVSTAFSKAGNLLASGMYYPYRMLTEYANSDPEAVRGLFRMLYDEAIPLAERYTKFQGEFKAHIEQLDSEKKLQHYQDLRAVMVYLTFEYPEKYYLFKSRMFSKFRDRVGYTEEKQKNKSVVWKIESYSRLCDIILKEIKADQQLIQVHYARLEEDCYQDPAMHLLTMDIVFYGSVYMSEKDFQEKPMEQSTNKYWPSLEEFNPGLTKDDWKRYLLEIEIPDHPAPMEMLKGLMELGGEATCKKLATVYGGTVSRYVGCTVNLGKRTKKYFNIPDSNIGDRERVYIIPFQGRDVKEDGATNYSYRIRPELLAALQELDLSAFNPYFNDEPEEDGAVTDVGLNTILYGPPGTGKTYHTVIYAVAIIENRELTAVAQEEYAAVLERYNEYKAQGRIEFTTFHQSYGYDEFIEGIRPAVVDEGDQADAGNIQYSVQPGVFKKFCEKAERPAVARTSTIDFGIRENATIWKVSLWSTGDNEVRSECLNNGHIRIGWDQYGKDITDETDFSEDGGRIVLNAFMNKMQVGDIVLSCYSASTIDAIGVVTGEYEWHENYEFFRRVRKVNWIAKGIRENILELNGGTSMTLASVYRLSNIALADVYKLIEKYQPAKLVPANRKENYVFIIDEINRGNISKIFGELITLIEATKRVGLTEGMKAVLPYSQKPFGVPKNVYIIGTMNTADRSIATIDTALRRRFLFKEMMPQPDVLAGVSVEDLSVSDMLMRMNKRIAVLFDREHTIGHAYFMPLKENPTIEALAEIFTNNIIPLLQEYFYEDYEKIRLVLGDNRKDSEEYQFIIAKENDYSDLFGDVDVGLDDGRSYEINYSAFDQIEAYRSI